MGRKIPGKHHKGVKDPATQKRNRLAKVSKKINAPPKNPDEQHIPNSLKRVMEVTRKVKDGTIPEKIKRKRKKPDTPVRNLKTRPIKKAHSGRPEKPVPVFKQSPGETQRLFLNRVNKVVNTILKETKFEKQYGVDIKRDPDTGVAVGVTKQEPDEIDTMMRKAKSSISKSKTNDKSNKKVEGKPSLTKSQKKQLKVVDRKLRKESAKKDDFNDFRDVVHFGDVAHEPPALKFPKRFLKTPEEKKMNTLMLQQMMEFSKNRGKRAAASTATKTVSTTAIDKNGKWKYLPTATREALESQHNSAIKAYKEMKAKMITAFQ